LNQTKERKDLSCQIKLFIFFSLIIPFVFYSEEEEEKKEEDRDPSVISTKKSAHWYFA
jgi:hypothetical protein